MGTFNYIAFIADKIIKSAYKSNRSKPIIKIAITSVALSVSIMIIAICVVKGFQGEITSKVVGFGSHVTIHSFSQNDVIEITPITKDSSLVAAIQAKKHVKHLQYYSIISGIAKSQEALQGIVFKGVDEDFEWNFFKTQLVKGRVPSIHKDSLSKEIILSQLLANKLELDVGDKLIVYFIQNPPKSRAFKIVGIYDTGMGEQNFDEAFILGDIKQVQNLQKWKQNEVTGIEVLIDDLQHLDELGTQIYTELPSELTSITIKERFPSIFDWLALQDINVKIIITLMVIVATLNMLTLLLIMVLERTATIGLLKTLGLSTKKLFQVFFIVMNNILFKGLIIGNVIGIGFCLLQKYFHLITLNKAIYYVSYVPIHIDSVNIILLNIGCIGISILVVALSTLFISRIMPSQSIIKS